MTLVSNTPQGAINGGTQLARITRANFSNPPAHGARIVSLVLNSPELFAEWYLLFVFTFYYPIHFIF